LKLRCTTPHHKKNVLELRIAKLGAKGRRTAISIANIGYWSTLVNDWQDAVRHQRRAVEIFAEILPPGHPKRSLNLAYLGNYLSGAGQPLEGLLVSLNGWRECKNAGFPPSMCAHVQKSELDSEFTLGKLTLALDTAISLAEAEDEMGHRANDLEADAEQTAAAILVSRGEILPATILSRRDLDRLHVDSNVHPNAVVRTFLQAVTVSLAAGLRAQTDELLREAQSILDQPGEGVELFRARLFFARAELDLANDQPQLAANGFESALAAQESMHRPANEVADTHRRLADSLLAGGNPDLVRFHAERALSLHQSIDGFASHLAVSFYQTLAAFAIASERFGDALMYLELAHIAFDSAEVLDNRRAPLYFLEARAWWELDRTKNGRAHARALAQKAVREYQGWDAGAEPSRASRRSGLGNVSTEYGCVTFWSQWRLGRNSDESTNIDDRFAVETKVPRADPNR
jgi:hypothetical protein